MANVKNRKILFVTQFALLAAIEAIVCFTPLGSLPAIGPIVATLSHIPVIITAIMLGTFAGTAMGFLFGLFSFIVWTFMPPSPVVAFIFTPFYGVGEAGGSALSLLICFVPRILIGVVAGLVFKGLEKALQKKKNTGPLVYGLSGFLGSMTNTLLVLGGIYLFFGRDYAAAIGKGFDLILGIIGMTILTSGIPEAVLAAVLVYAICKPLKHLLEKQRL